MQYAAVPWTNSAVSHSQPWVKGTADAFSAIPTEIVLKGEIVNEAFLRKTVNLLSPDWLIPPPSEFRWARPLRDDVSPDGSSRLEINIACEIALGKHANVDWVSVPFVVMKHENERGIREISDLHCGVGPVSSRDRPSRMQSRCNRGDLQH
ncbi:hypothetical protein AGOR_G00033420 [Albula goreensis]|uniref:Uncharacterized protein n=1 Tax=Albula goreensis TaxID=1534307 RepID=A0A8T3E169_9TELE|nr:hypothetical protein AGOR_G00033420 [Albula goreensis]